MAEKFDISIIRVALEHTTFKDFKIRDDLNSYIRNLQQDLEDIGFEPSEQMRVASDVLENTLDDVEGPDGRRKKDEKLRIDIDETPLDGVRAVRDDSEIPVTTVPRVVNVDDELNEYE